jgi:hypothetical protein
VGAALDAEAAARAARDKAEADAQAALKSARSRAQLMSRKADARIERAQRRAAAMAQRELETIHAQRDTDETRIASNPFEQSAIEAAARAIAERVTSSGEAHTAMAPDFGAS